MYFNKEDCPRCCWGEMDDIDEDELLSTTKTDDVAKPKPRSSQRNRNYVEYSALKFVLIPIIIFSLMMVLYMWVDTTNANETSCYFLAYNKYEYATNGDFCVKNLSTSHESPYFCCSYEENGFQLLVTIISTVITSMVVTGSILFMCCSDYGKN